MTAKINGIRMMPTFFFYKNRKKVDEMQGADPTGLEDKINQWIGGAVDSVVRLQYTVVNIWRWLSNSTSFVVLSFCSLFWP